MAVVSMDAQAMRDAAARMDRFVEDAREGWPRARGAANWAMLPTSRTDLVLAEQLDEVVRLRRELCTRIDLIELVDEVSLGRPSGGMVTIEMPDGDSMYQVRRAIGSHLARAVGSLDTGSTAAVQELVTRLAGYADDGVAMAAFYEELGAHDLLEVMKRAALSPTDGTLAVLEDLKRGLHAADGEWNDEHRRRFAGLLVDAATDHEISPTSASHFSSALAYLLHDSTYSSTFLSTTAEFLDTAERSAPVSDGRWTVDPLGVDAWARLYPADAAIATWDPVTSLMTALANDPDQALAFFSGPERDARFVHYLRDRPWHGDDFDAIAAAVDSAATTFHTVGDPRARDAAWVASATVWYFGERPYIGEAGKDSLGHLLAHHVASIERTAKLGEGALGTWAPLDDIAATSPPASANFENARLRSVLGAVLTHETALTHVRRAVNGYTGARLADSARGVDDQYASDGTGAFLDATKDVATLNGYLLGAMNAGKEAQTGEQVESVRAFVGFAKDLAGMLPPGGQALTWVAGSVLDHASAGGDSTWPDAAARVKDESATAEFILQREIQVAVGVSLIEAGKQLPHGDGIDPAVYPWNTHRRFDRGTLNQPEVMERFAEWAPSQGLQNFVETDIVVNLGTGYDRGHGDIK